MKPAVVLLLGLIFVSSVSSLSSAREVPGADTDLRQFTPLEFLNYLKTDTRPMRVYTIREPVTCWITQEDIPGLISRLESDERSMSVALSIASRVRKQSREADEAAYLIEGFRLGKYPPTLGSEPATPAKVAEIRHWWTSYQAGLAPQIVGSESCD